MYPGTFNLLLDDKTRRDELLGSIFSEETYTYFICEHNRLGFSISSDNIALFMILKSFHNWVFSK